MTKRIKLLLLFLISLLTFPIVKAEKIESTYTGDYSIDYLIRNYSAITFGMNDNVHLEGIVEELPNLKKGNIDTVAGIYGPILVNGDYVNNSTNDIEFATNSTNSISFIKGNIGNNVTTTSKTITNNDYVDFSKMYNQVVGEQQDLVEKTQYHINSKNIQINKPGIYQINSTRFGSNHYTLDVDEQVSISNLLFNFPTYFAIKFIYIDNYNPNDYYIFNNMKLFEFDNYVVLIKKSGDSNFILFEDYVSTGEYTGNIIFNYPNAKFINVHANSGKIIAPKADIILSDAKFYSSNTEITYHDSIFANSITGNVNSYTRSSSKIEFFPYSISKKISLNAKEIESIKDYQDDLYTGTYSIEEMLKNYNLVTLGQKEYGTNTKFYNNGGFENGSAVIFHVVGQFLINGDLVSQRQDLESNYTNESAIDGNLENSLQYQVDGYTYTTYDEPFKRWGENDEETGTNSVVYIQSDYTEIYDRTISNPTSFINFNRLYDTIVNEQKKINDGTAVENNNGVAHIKIGGSYYINDINEIDKIVFDDFEENKDKLTIITIKNNGNIQLPVIRSDATGDKGISTKDYVGKKEALFEYEYYNFPEDIYFGNIIWNVPEATFIELAENAPFIGHLIAPNADVETPELHFSGCFIVNSLYTTGNTEAHFYPLNSMNVKNVENNYSSLVLGLPIIDDTPENDNINNPNTTDGLKAIITLGVLILSVIIIIRLRNFQGEKIS